MMYVLLNLPDMTIKLVYKHILDTSMLIVNFNVICITAPQYLTLNFYCPRRIRKNHIELQWECKQNLQNINLLSQM